MVPFIGIGQGCELDFNEDGLVNTPDLLEFLQYFDTEVECGDVINFYNAPNYYNTIYGNNGLTPTPEPDSVYTYNILAFREGEVMMLKPNTCINVNFIVMTGQTGWTNPSPVTINCPNCVGEEVAKLYVHTPVLGNNTFPEWNVHPLAYWNVSTWQVEIINEPCN